MKTRFSFSTCFFRQVSWLKRHGDTPHLLTFGLTTYSSDARFQIFHEQPNDWKLQIQFPNLDDSGVFECLVSTNPPLVRRTRLTVIGKDAHKRQKRFYFKVQLILALVFISVVFTVKWAKIIDNKGK